MCMCFCAGFSQCVCVRADSCAGNVFVSLCVLYIFVNSAIHSGVWQAAETGVILLGWSSLDSTAQNMLSNRATSAAPMWLKQGGQAAMTADHRVPHTHRKREAYALWIFLLVEPRQYPRGGQNSSCMETLHVQIYYLPSALCTTGFVHPHGACLRHPSASTYSVFTCRLCTPPLSSSSCHRPLPVSSTFPFSQLPVLLLWLSLLNPPHLSSSILLLLYSPQSEALSPRCKPEAIAQPDIKVGTLVGQLLSHLKWAERTAW